MRRGELQWRCRRGMQELDLPLQRYLDCAYAAANPFEQTAFVRLLEEPDHRLWGYLYGGLNPEDPALAELIRKIRRAVASRP
jgi:antitoxin CptB